MKKRKGRTSSNKTSKKTRKGDHRNVRRSARIHEYTKNTRKENRRWSSRLRLKANTVERRDSNH